MLDTQKIAIPEQSNAAPTERIQVLVLPAPRYTPGATQAPRHRAQQAYNDRTFDVAMLLIVAAILLVGIAATIIAWQLLPEVWNNL
jgi:hypothetical protein